MLTTGELLKQYWVSHSKIRLNAGATEPELIAFERKHNICLPKDLKEYFSKVNGFDEYDTDDGMFYFLPLDEIEPLSKDRSDKPEAKSYFIILDYLISAHVYAIQLNDDSQSNTPIFIAYDKNPKKIAESFSEFAQAYLNNDYRILFP